MNTPLTLQKISKKQLTSPMFCMSEADAKLLMKYRRKLSVIDDAETYESSVEARKLHEQLGITTPFTIWIKRRVTQFNLVDGKDFSTFLLESNGGRPTIEYNLTIDTAKHLAMTEKNDAGMLIRNYFLLCEKFLKHAYQYNPFRILSKQNNEKLGLVYEKDYRSKVRPERFFPKINNLIARTATGASAAQWRDLGYKNMQDFMESKDEQVYTHVQDTVIRMLESGQDFASIKELCDMLYPDEQRNIYSKYKLAAANDCCLMNAA